MTDSRKSAGVIKYCPSTSTLANWSNLVFRRVCEWPWSDLARTTFKAEVLFWPADFHSKQHPTPPTPTSVMRNNAVLLANEENIAWEYLEDSFHRNAAIYFNPDGHPDANPDRLSERLGSNRHRWPSGVVFILPYHAFHFTKHFIDTCGTGILGSAFCAIEMASAVTDYCRTLVSD